MKNIILFIIALKLTALCACHKDDYTYTPPPPPVDTIPVNFKLLWQRPITPDTAKTITEVQYVWNHNVIYGVTFRSPRPSLEMRDSDGKLKWIFEQFIAFPTAFNNGLTTFGVQDKTLFFQDRAPQCIDNNTGQQVWGYDLRNNEHYTDLFSNVINDYLYLTQTSETTLNAKASKTAVRIHVSGARWDTLFTIFKTADGYYPFIKPPTFWINPQGDTILLYRNQETYFGSPPAPKGFDNGKLCAFNLRTRKFEWQREKLDESGIFTFIQMTVDGNNLYLVTEKTVFCLNAGTGATIWKKEMGEDVRHHNMIVDQNTLVVQSSNTGMWGLDKYTGYQRWYNKDTDGFAENLVCFDGIVYFTSTGYGRLYAIRAKTGETIWKEFSPNALKKRSPDASFFEAGVAIDTERRVLYTADKYYLMCIELPK